jgi:hypothetical protein
MHHFSIESNPEAAAAWELAVLECVENQDVGV